MNRCPTIPVAPKIPTRYLRLIATPTVIALNLGSQASRLQRFESGAAVSCRREAWGPRSKADQLKASSYPLHALAQRVVIRTERHSQKSFALAAKRNARNGDHARL